MRFNKTNAIIRKEYVHRIICIILSSILILSGMCCPLRTQASNSKDDDFLRIFHLDNGRKYYSVNEIKGLIDEISKDNYTHMELAVGNDGMRFLLNDMAIVSCGKTYSSGDVKAAVHSGNLQYDSKHNYSPSIDELTEAEMNNIINYAKSKNIEIIPLINNPGHMNAILSAMDTLGIENSRFKANSVYSDSTVDLTSEEAVAFTQDFLQKYIDYFSSKGCNYFNMGADEYAWDIGVTFQGLINRGIYYKFIDYINYVSARIKGAGMKPIAFNDGIYYNNRKPPGYVIDTDILIAYWHSGWSGNNCRSAENLINDGFSLINTNGNWYDVPDANNYHNSAMNGVKSVAFDEMHTRGTSQLTYDDEGCMLCLWSDIPAYNYSAWKDRLFDWISTFSERNPKVFGIAAPPQGETLTYNGTVQTGVDSNNRLNVVGNTAKNAGTYEAVVTPVKGCSWTDAGCGRDWDEAKAKTPRKVVYTISKAKLTASYVSEIVAWNGTPKYQVKVTGFKGSDNASNSGGYMCPTVSKVNTAPGKTYSLTPSGGKADNYAFKYVKGTLSVGNKPSAPAPKEILIHKAVRKNRSTLTVTWNAISGAQEYQVWAAPCNTKKRTYKLKKIKTVKSSASRKAVIKGLKADNYKVCVYAYKTVNGQKKRIASGRITHTHMKTDRYNNTTKVSVKKTSIKIKKGKAATIKASASTSRGKKLFYSGHCKPIYYVSNNPAIASVNATTGKVSAKNKGTCKIYAIAPNGIYKTITLTVY